MGKKEKRKIVIVVAVVIFYIFALIAPDDDDLSNNSGSTALPKKNSVSTQQPVSSPTPKVEYDALQQLYLDLDSNMSYKEMLHLVKSTKLPYSEEKYNGSVQIQVAFTEGCTVQKHMKESGDYLEIIYRYSDNENSANDNTDNYIFGTCAYIPYNSDLELISHFCGQYFDYDKPGNYISDLENLGKPLDLDKKMSKKDQLDYYFKHK